MKTLVYTFVAFAMMFSTVSQASNSVPKLKYGHEGVSTEIAEAIMSEEFVKLFFTAENKQQLEQITKIGDGEGNYYVTSDSCGMQVVVTEEVVGGVPRHPETYEYAYTAKAITGTLICGPYF